ncbi:MAG: STAS-like domain-containing protein [Acidobacteria bacterium]|nr:STAS-like domain-containing protein [Acidobacteriota bacterium]MBI3425729.1 STAS-like domain-containing protein [Acidobacteriota bacterium]
MPHVEASPLIIINISEEFSRFPGARYKKDGPHSGEEFREKLLKPRFKEALEQGRKLFVNLDGAEGYATSFLEEAFGGLAREYGVPRVLSQLELQCFDEPLLVDEIKKYIRDVARR